MGLYSWINSTGAISVSYLPLLYLPHAQESQLTTTRNRELCLGSITSKNYQPRILLRRYWKTKETPKEAAHENVGNTIELEVTVGGEPVKQSKLI